MGKIIIDPVNRMEGHLGVEADTGAAESDGVRIRCCLSPRESLPRLRADHDRP